MVWVIAFGELFFGDLWCVVWGYGGMRTHFSLLNPESRKSVSGRCVAGGHLSPLTPVRVTDCVYDKNGSVGSGGECITTFDQEK